MSIKALANANIDNMPIKPKEITKNTQNISSIEENISSDPQRQAKQNENIILGVKQITDFIAESMNLDMSSARVSFSKDSDTGDIVIEVIDSKTDEVIKQIPPEEIVELRKRISDLQGLFLDRKI